MYTLDDLDRAIIDHIKAHPRAQTVADLHQALQARAERPTREQVKWRVRGLHAAGHLTCEAHTSPHVRGVTYTYALRPVAFLTPTMTDAERVAAIRTKEPHAQRPTPDQDAAACGADLDPLSPALGRNRGDDHGRDGGESQDREPRPIPPRPPRQGVPRRGGEDIDEPLLQHLEDQAMTQPRPTTSARSVPVKPLLLDALACFDGVPPWVAEAIEARALAGVERYGTPLHTHNGRDAVRDLREELLDAMQYLAQAHAEGRISAPVYVPSLAALVGILAIIGGPTDAP